MLRFILTLLVLTICRNVEGSRKGRKELLDALSLIMSEASQVSKVKNNGERTSGIDLGKREPLLLRGLDMGGLYREDSENNSDKIPEHSEAVEEIRNGRSGGDSVEFPHTPFIQERLKHMKAEQSVEFDTTETCTTTRTEITTREECKQVVELECKPVVRFRTEIQNRCTTLVNQDCKVVFKDEPERKCLATEEEHCHTAYKKVEENHYKDECHTDIQNICEEQIRVPVEVPYPVKVPYPVYPKATPHPSRHPAHPYYEQYPTNPKSEVNTKSHNNYKPTERSTTVAPPLSEFYLIIPETQDAKAELNRHPKSLGEPYGEATEQPTYAYNPTPTPKNTPLSDFIRKLDRMHGRRRREVDNEGPLGPPGSPSLLFNKTLAEPYSKAINKPSTFVRELPAPPGCRSIVTKTCNRVPFTVAHKVPYEKCEMVPGVKCHLELEKVAQLECVPVVDEECNDFAKKVPYQDEEEECEEVIYDECVEVRFS